MARTPTVAAASAARAWPAPSAWPRPSDSAEGVWGSCPIGLITTDGTRSPAG
jgi:hypothetical protein